MIKYRIITLLILLNAMSVLVKGTYRITCYLDKLGVWYSNNKCIVLYYIVFIVSYHNIVFINIMPEYIISFSVIKFIIWMINL